MVPLYIADESPNWVSGDVHVHMNYAGTYRNTPAHLVEQAAAENLAIVEDLVVNKEQRIPDMAYFSPKLDPASTWDHLLLHGQEFHTSYWGHLGLAEPDDAISFFRDMRRIPIRRRPVSIPQTRTSPTWRMNRVRWSDMCILLTVFPTRRKMHHLHPSYLRMSRSGKVDYIEVLGFSDHKSTAEVWYKLLNCGFRLPTAAGTDFMGNYASLRGPVGLNRVYANLPVGP